MQYVFLTTTIVGALYLVTRTRRFDFLSILYFAGLFYCLHAFQGFVESRKSYGYFYFEITPYVYSCLAAYFGTLTVGVLLYDWILPVSPSLNDTPELRWKFTEYAIASFTLTTIFFIGFMRDDWRLILTTIDKHEIMEKLSRFHTLFQIGATLTVVTSLVSRQRVLIMSSVFFVLVDLYIGFRFVFAISAVAVIVSFADRIEEVKPMYLRWRLVLGGISAGAVVLVIKRFYKAIKSGDEELYSRGYEFIFNTPQQLLLNSEAEGVMVMFLAALERDVRVDADYFTNQLSGFVPFAPMFGIRVEESYNEIVQGSLLGISREVTGLAASSLGEWHALGGFWGIVVFALTILICIIGLTKLRIRGPEYYAPCMVLMSILAFYNYRNGIHQLSHYTRNIILLWLVVMALARLIHLLRPRPSTQRLPSTRLPGVR